jgi:predicted phage terminase large subunit-like protein
VITPSLLASLDARLAAHEARHEELRRRADTKEAQSRYGWYDEEGVRQGGLIAFIRYFWHILEPATPFVDGGPLWAICEHLEAVTKGDITRLLMNVPPGFSKSLCVNCFWPSWEWGPMGRAHERYLSFSYSASLTERDNRRLRDLISSDEYRVMYPDVRIRNDAVGFLLLESTGWKLAGSVGGSTTGQRGSRILLDDPHNVIEAESDTVRTETVRWMRESMSNRLQDADRDSIICIMQRVHEDDVSGVILSEQLGYVNLMIPMRYDADRQTHGQPNEIGWLDPRYDEDDYKCDGVLAWPERFSADACEKLEKTLGPYSWAGQYQQAPAPRGGGLFKSEWWQLYNSPDNKFPACDYVFASLDGAFTEKKQNDPSALTVWGCYLNERRQRRIVLMSAWRKHLAFSGPRVDRLERPTMIDGKFYPADIVVIGMSPAVVAERNRNYQRRTQSTWGLIEHVAHSCRQFKVNCLLIEAAGPGLPAAQELRKRLDGESISVITVPPKGDKMARALACLPMFSQQMIYAPDREWAQLVIDEMANFPVGRYDDLCDSTSQALNYLRSIGLAAPDAEVAAGETDRATHRAQLRALYGLSPGSYLPPSSAPRP